VIPHRVLLVGGYYGTHNQRLGLLDIVRCGNTGVGEKDTSDYRFIPQLDPTGVIYLQIILILIGFSPFFHG
jgi:hypothetical protein